MFCKVDFAGLFFAMEKRNGCLAKIEKECFKSTITPKGAK
jgi:hypothetical protein